MQDVALTLMKLLEAPFFLNILFGRPSDIALQKLWRIALSLLPSATSLQFRTG